ncbi:ribosomal protein S18-alanine N-acetyltransferase [Methylophilaceae bacterium]|jgi:[ribosomal protein S18]-alanine N-acetyltransferase|nr:ribosomal protein S18-alanine N-acetyltransferase [Methylophilaceae bacterium]|tara:strand:+ start:2373 stop:2819 length:447 start_codon:yes stop_codon:yes gene_type:complete
MLKNKISMFTEEDLVDVVKIEKRCHLTPWTNKNFIDSYGANNLFKVLKNENDIIGYYIALFSFDECELLNITIKSELQQKGLGELMLNDLLSECRKANIANIFLEVRKSNLVAIKLYKKIGFNDIGVRNNYYQNKDGKEDAILMGLAT